MKETGRKYTLEAYEKAVPQELEMEQKLEPEEKSRPHQIVPHPATGYVPPVPALPRLRTSSRSI